MPSSWKKSLKIILATRAAETKPFRAAVLGVGNELNGDDAAGVCVVRGLQFSVERPDLLVIEAGLAPENFTGPLRRFEPGLVILVDAAEMGEPPGTISLLDWRTSTGFGPSTHLQPPSTFAEFLIADLGCEVILLGIQPAQLDLDAPLSPSVRAAVSQVRSGLRALFGEY